MAVVSVFLPTDLTAQGFNYGTVTFAGTNSIVIQAGAYNYTYLGTFG